MRAKTKKIALTAAVLLLLAIILLGSANIFLSMSNEDSQTKTFTPHYITYQGATSRIYLLSATSSYTLDNQTTLSPNGSELQKGSLLFTLNLTLRNDYSSENPPPSKGTPITPIDGTAYICLNLTLYSKDGKVDAPNVAQSDFTVVPNSQTALIVASGQTSNAELLFATNQTDISRFELSLVFVGDSIPAV